MKKVVLFCLANAFILFPSLPTYSLEVGVSVTGGVGFWSGDWSDSQRDFSEDLGQNAVLTLFPAGTVLVDATFLSEGRFFKAWSFGAGTWGGRYLSSGGTVPVRVSTIAAIGVECAPSIGYRLPLAESELRASIRAGLGALVSPVYAIDAFHSVTSKIEYDVEMVDRAYAFAGATLSYGIPVSSLTLSLFLSADVGMADFYAASGGDSIILSRVGLGFRLSHENSKKRPVR